MKSVDILYFVEHVARELDIACAVKAIIERDTELRVEIVSITHRIEETLTNFQPRVVTLPYCVAVHEAGLDKIVARWPQAEYVSLSYEQVLGQAQKDLNSPKDEFAQKFVLYHAWGDFFAEYLKTHAVPPEHIYINGNPSYALYRPPYADYYDNQREALAKQFGLDAGKRWVFIPENYGWAFFEDHMVRARIRRGFDPQQAYEYRDFARASLRAVSIWWREAAKIDELEIIIRPRPAIPAQNFIERVRECAGDLPNRLHFIKHGTVREWILAADVVVSSYSTTMLEGAVARKPVYMLAPQPFPALLHADWYALTDQLETQTDFLAAISQKELTKNWVELEKWLIPLMMSRGDAIANIARMLTVKAKGELSTPPPLEIARQLERVTAERLYRTARKHGWRLFQNTLAALGIQTQDQGWTAHESDAINPAEIARRVKRWREILV
ncbi:MAG: hypothetical protein HN413_17290 [Chloroflexi bacterium]|jgi:surface carbohydrate biosynthesis protein|nr:hypothetical protein [Chloroflexota bacterium]